MTIIIGKVADTAAKPAQGRIEFTQAVRFDDGQYQVTSTMVTAQVIDGELRTLEGDPFTLPPNPENTAVEIRELLGGLTFVWWASVPDADVVEYRELPLVESEDVPASVWGPPPWLASAYIVRDEIDQSVADGQAIVDSLGGLAGLNAKVQQATDAASQSSASATAAYNEAQRAQAAADSIDMSAINTRLDGVDATVATKASNSDMLARFARRSYSPEEFGAVGNGVANDTAALQAAVDASAKGGTVVFAPGVTYRLDGPIIIPTDTTIEGNGATLLKTTTATSDVVLTNKMYSKGYGGGGKCITIRNLKILGDYSATRDTTSPFMHVTGLRVENCVFEQGMKNGHYLDILGCDDVLVTGCSFRGMNPGSGREIIEAIQVDSATRSGSGGAHFGTGFYDGIPTRNIKVESCTFLPLRVGSTDYPMPNPLGAHGGALVGDDGLVRGVWFVNNTVSGWTPDYAGNYWHGWLHLPGFQDVVIEGNVFTYTGPVRTTGGRGGIIVSRDVQQVIPLAQVEAASPTTVAPTSARSAKSWKVADNIFRGFENNFVDSFSALILIDGTATDSISVTGNVASASKSGLCRIENDKNVTVANNTAEITGDSAGIHLVSCMGIVQGNRLRAAVSVGIYIVGGQFMLVDANNVFGAITAIRYVNVDNGQITNNVLFQYTGTAITVGANGDTGTCFDIGIIANRMSAPSTSKTASISIGTKATRAFRYGNRYRDGGAISDNGSGSLAASALDTN